jgi:calcium-dependent protein kinase
MWSIGVVAFILLSGKMPFQGKTLKGYARKIHQGTYSMGGPEWKKVSSPAKRFVRSLLRYEPGRRFSAAQALKSPWLTRTYNAKERAPQEDVMNRIEEDLVKAHKASKFKRVAAMVIAYRMPVDELKELRAAFDAIDVSNCGCITYGEFQTALEQHGNFHFSTDQMKQMFDDLDMSRTGEINYTEFLSAVLLSRRNIEEDRIRAAFDKLDLDRSGFIDRADLVAVLQSHSTTKGAADDAELEKILQELDVDGDGRISYDEFHRLFFVDRDSTPSSVAAGQ